MDISIYCKIITTKSLVNLCTIYSYKYFLWWELLRFIFLATFTCAIYIVLLTIVTILFIISPGLNSFITKIITKICIFLLHALQFACSHISPEFLYLCSDSTCKWGHMVLVFLHLISFSIMLSRSLHVITKVKISFFLWLNNCLLYIFIHIIQTHTHAPVHKVSSHVLWKRDIYWKRYKEHCT